MLLVHLRAAAAGASYCCLCFSHRLRCNLQVLLACVFVPGWLAVIRELLQQHQSGPAAAVAVAGLSVMLLSDIVNRSVAAERRAAAAVAVTPGTVQQLLSSGQQANTRLWWTGAVLGNVNCFTGACTPAVLASLEPRPTALHAWFNMPWSSEHCIHTMGRYSQNDGFGIA